MPNKRGIKILTVVLGTMLLMGCNRSTLPAGYYGTTSPNYGTPSYTSPNYTQPTYGSNPYGSSPYDPYGNNFYGSNPYGTGYGDPNMAQRSLVPPLVASIEGIQNGEFLGIGRFVVRVRILNPTQGYLAGMLRVDFMAGSKVYRTTRDRVMLGPGQSTEKTFEDPAWRVNNAHVAIEADTPFSPMSGAQPMDPNLNYNQPYGL